MELVNYLSHSADFGKLNLFSYCVCSIGNYRRPGPAHTRPYISLKSTPRKPGQCHMSNSLIVFSLIM